MTLGAKEVYTELCSGFFFEIAVERHMDRQVERVGKLVIPDSRVNVDEISQSRPLFRFQVSKNNFRGQILVMVVRKQRTEWSLSAPGFLGGYFGFGGPNQLSGPLDQATQDLADQEAKEHEQNLGDQQWISPQNPTRIRPQGDQVPGELDEAGMPTRAVFDMDTPGFPPMNTLVAKKNWLPPEEPEPQPNRDFDADEYVDSVIKHNKVSRIHEDWYQPGSTGADKQDQIHVSGQAGQHHRLVRPIDFSQGHYQGSPRSPSEAESSHVGWLRDFVPEDWENASDPEEDELEESCSLVREKFVSKAQRRFFYAKAKQTGKSGAKWKKWAAEWEKETPSEEEEPLPEIAKENVRKMQNNKNRELVKGDRVYAAVAGMDQRGTVVGFTSAGDIWQKMGMPQRRWPTVLIRWDHIPDRLSTHSPAELRLAPEGSTVTGASPPGEE
jgi:hypothetical protein